jgi:hypothetical protein
MEWKFNPKGYYRREKKEASKDPPALGKLGK